MKLSRQDLPLIRSALALLLATLVIGTIAVWGSGRYAVGQQEHLQETKNRLAAVRTQLQQVHQEEEDIRRYHARYQDLVTRGLIGEEKRLDWMESITRIKRERKLFEINYEIAAQQPVATTPSLAMGGMQLLASGITLRFGLLHEGDLLVLLDDLKKQGTGLYVLQQCQISRREGAPAEGLQPRLDAVCTLAWLTLTEKK